MSGRHLYGAGFRGKQWVRQCAFATTMIERFSYSSWIVRNLNIFKHLRIVKNRASSENRKTMIGSIEVSFFPDRWMCTKLKLKSVGGRLQTIELHSDDIDTLVHLVSNWHDHHKLFDLPVRLGFGDRSSCYLYGPTERFQISENLSVIRTTQRQTVFIIKDDWNESADYFPVSETECGPLIELLKSQRSELIAKS
ncbi:hypothetical protein SAMN05444003_3199 [Cognatiyoonia sediminum]|uniref:Uncharacterized protein n=1 Tax=Cognatiyoonia sediminum TaxID=1508389 RepID=A0A1M5SYX6_9RHOB|nr:hypothetical protein SAMN05444003_3199 [Cognatiyoonia sediminum]